MGGSNRLKLMIGASDFYSEDEGRTLTFRFKGSNKANCFKITLNYKDLYDIKFIKVHRVNVKKLLAGTHKLPTVVYTAEDVYVDSVKELFERFTGLYLSL